MTARLQRAAFVRIYESDAELNVITPKGRVQQFRDASAELTRAVLDFLCQPQTYETLVAHISELSGQDAATVVAETVTALRAAGVVEAAPDPHAARPTQSHAGAQVVVALCG
ncbi:MAG TPA: hypothetical protein PKD61_12445, partial [Polyangiaceae bacterium]|nr:hypothetical protein [Polyangiaceae bacterium]